MKLSAAESVNSELEGPSSTITATISAFCFVCKGGNCIYYVIMMTPCTETIACLTKHFVKKMMVEQSLTSRCSFAKSHMVPNCPVVDYIQKLSLKVW